MTELNQKLSQKSFYVIPGLTSKGVLWTGIFLWIRLFNRCHVGACPGPDPGPGMTAPESTIFEIASRLCKCKDLNSSTQYHLPVRIQPDQYKKHNGKRKQGSSSVGDKG